MSTDESSVSIFSTYRQKETIQAIQWNGTKEGADRIIAGCRGRVSRGLTKNYLNLRVAWDGSKKILPGDWIFGDMDGLYFSVSSDSFFSSHYVEIKEDTDLMRELGHVRNKFEDAEADVVAAKMDAAAARAETAAVQKALEQKPFAMKVDANDPEMLAALLKMARRTAHKEAYDEYVKWRNGRLGNSIDSRAVSSLDAALRNLVRGND